MIRTPETVAGMRARYARGESKNAIARHYRCHRDTVSAAVDEGLPVSVLGRAEGEGMYSVYVREDNGGGWTCIKTGFRYPQDAERWARRKVGYRTWEVRNGEQIASRA